MFKFKKIPVPLDGSEFAETALEPALAIAKAMAVKVVLFRVAETIPRTHELMKTPGQIVDYAANNGVDLIVMSSHGRSGVKC